MQAEGNRICSVHLSDHETGAVSALELLLLLKPPAYVCIGCLFSAS